MPPQGASSQPAQLCQQEFCPQSCWEPGSPCPTFSICSCCPGRRDALSFKCAAKTLLITFSNFQEKKWGAGKKNCARGELVQVSQASSGPNGRPGTAALGVGRQNLWAALWKGSSVVSQIVFLLPLPWEWEMHLCRDRSAQGPGEERSETAPLSQTQHMLL